MSDNEIRPPARGADAGKENPADEPDQPPPAPAPSVPPPAAPPHPAVPGPISEAQIALEEARRALRLAAEKAGIALREVGKEVGAEMGAAAADVREAVRAERRAAPEGAGSAPAATGATRPVPPATSVSPLSDTRAPETDEPRSEAAGSSRTRARSDGSTTIAEPWESGPTAIGLDANVAAALSYVGWAMTGILFYYVFEPRDRFVRFHAMQSILLTAALMVVGVSMAVVPLIGPFLFRMAAVGFILVWILAIWKALRYEEYPLPFIGEISRSQVARGRR